VVGRRAIDNYLLGLFVKKAGGILIDATNVICGVHMGFDRWQYKLNKQTMEDKDWNILVGKNLTRVYINKASFILGKNGTFSLTRNRLDRHNS
jgi:hypothetical protein